MGRIVKRMDVRYRIDGPVTEDLVVLFDIRNFYALVFKYKKHRILVIKKTSVKVTCK